MPRTASSKVPAGYRRLAGSERRAQPGAKRIGPAPAGEPMEVTVILRRRPDGPDVPGHHEYLSPPSRRPRLSADEFAERYGFDPADRDRVTEFAERHGLEVTGAHSGRRAMYLAGTVEQFQQAFAVSLGRYEYERETRRRGGRREVVSETVGYRGREGHIHVPTALADAIVGVFGLDDRSITHRNLADPPARARSRCRRSAISTSSPANQAAGQTIAIFSEAGYQSSDIDANFGGSPPLVTDVSVDASNDGSADPETTQDIFIAASVAPGADVAVYFTGGSQQGWVDLIGRVVHPDPGDPVCSVLSSSFYILNGDDAAARIGHHRRASSTPSRGVRRRRDPGRHDLHRLRRHRHASPRSPTATRTSSTRDRSMGAVRGGTTIGDVNRTGVRRMGVWNDSFGLADIWVPPAAASAASSICPAIRSTRACPRRSTTAIAGAACPTSRPTRAPTAATRSSSAARLAVAGERHERVGAAVGRADRGAERGAGRERRLRQPGAVRARLQRVPRHHRRIPAPATTACSASPAIRSPPAGTPARDGAALGAARC